MSRTASRTYKLKLSSKGIDLFLECHCRLCRLVCDFLPYGTTLYVAVLLLEHVPDGELASEAVAPDLASFGGREIRFVGTSPRMSQCMTVIADRLMGSDTVYPLPQIWKLYLAALNLMRMSEDHSLLSAYDELCKAEHGIKPRNVENGGR